MTSSSVELECHNGQVAIESNPLNPPFLHSYYRIPGESKELWQELKLLVNDLHDSKKRSQSFGRVVELLSKLEPFIPKVEQAVILVNVREVCIFNLENAIMSTSKHFPF